MTRITSFGIKRTYVQAGFGTEGEKDVVLGETMDEECSQAPPQKKRKRIRRKPKAEVESAVDDNTTLTRNRQTDPDKYKNKTPSRKSKHKSVDKKTFRQPSSEQRRRRRIQERKSSTTCFICREKGHAAKECPTGVKATTESEGEAVGGVVGMCYRCGSHRHNLSRCKKPIDEFNPLPFASCFVCRRKGHLTSTCPENRERGVYPNGGSCKLCGETSHLAKDCGLRRQDAPKVSMLLGTGAGAGADEDDFHILNRKKREIDREERREEKKKRELDVKACVHSGVIKASAEAKRKVVHF